MIKITQRYIITRILWAVQILDTDFQTGTEI